jgi:hypothetical protein
MRKLISLGLALFLSLSALAALAAVTASFSGDFSSVAVHSRVPAPSPLPALPPSAAVAQVLRGVVGG